jgi:hypothetical protein
VSASNELLSADRSPTPLGQSAQREFKGSDFVPGSKLEVPDMDREVSALENLMPQSCTF